ncbi:SDR family oxidoreductase [Novosphingobium sp. KCTC 2891]|uniref:SDR family NAD(P)-dependent oxidoreductase n=1 Tax=Novosphingobium sp. KCTC 2891 TaxID=2989730 RepID=UPI002221F2E7|nr:SDR family oxidoreductase [Novosphingobium sp. KCTC 2891]MCW1384698.1 SDR family oxidoreductase [Novosphingobium sp. KCTC 2891]
MAGIDQSGPRAIAIVGASGGLGGAVARRIAQDRPVLLGYRSNRAAVDALAEQIRGEGGRADVGALDLRDPVSVAGFLAGAAALGGLGGIVSASGAPFPMGPLADADVGQLREILEIEVVGAFNLLHAAVPLLREAGGGAIVLFLTTAVERTMEHDALNSVPKAAIAMMMRHIAREEGAHNIRCNGIAPGVIDAGRTDIVATLPPIVQQVVTQCVADTPLPRLGRPDEVAALAAHLVSDAGGYINGQIIRVDGGYAA